MPKTQKKTTGHMTNEEYIASAGNECPCCKSRNIMSVGEMNTDCDYAWRQAECHDCGALWTENYQMTSYTLDSGPTN